MIYIYIYNIIIIIIIHANVFPDWESLLEVDTLSKDYWPFPSKEFALLFFFGQWVPIIGELSK